MKCIDKMEMFFGIIVRQVDEKHEHRGSRVTMVKPRQLRNSESETSTKNYWWPRIRTWG